MEENNIIKFEELKDESKEVSEEVKEISNFMTKTMNESESFLKVLETVGNRLDETYPAVTNFSLNEIITIFFNEIASEMGIPESTLNRRIKDYDEADLEVIADALDIFDEALGKSFREDVLQKFIDGELSID